MYIDIPQKRKNLKIISLVNSVDQSERCVTLLMTLLNEVQHTILLNLFIIITHFKNITTHIMNSILVYFK